MKFTRFSETQIIAILKEAESDSIVAEICDKYGISEFIFQSWKTKFGEPPTSDDNLLNELDANLTKIEQEFEEMLLSGEVVSTEKKP